MPKSIRRKSSRQKVDNRDARLIQKARATDGSELALSELTGQEFRRRTAADSYNALERLKHAVALRKGQDIEFSFTEKMQAEDTCPPDEECEVSRTDPEWER